MSLLCVNDLAFSYPASPELLFSKVSFTISPRERIALVGTNGCGKTTLLRVLIQELSPSSGTIVPKPELQIASVSQTCVFQSGEQALQYVLRADKALFSILQETLALEECLQDNECALRYADLLNQYEEQGGYVYETQAKRILAGLGVNSDTLVSQLSGGERTKLELAKLLLRPGDLLLLDEPTNHLDVRAIEWLEGYLKSVSAAVLVISHDRAFLDSFALKVFEMRQGALTVFDLGYSAYRAERTRLDNDSWERYEEGIRRIAKARQAYLARMQKASEMARTPKGQGIREGKDFYQAKAARMEKTAKILKERPFQEDIAEKPVLQRHIQGLRFPDFHPSGECVLTLHDVSKGFAEKQLFEGLSLSVFRGERWGILGPNGSGKTTLLRIVLGQVSSDSGKVEWGARVRLGVLSQTGEELDLSQTPYEAGCSVHSDPRWVVTILAALKVRGGLIHRSIGQLSPGERVKVAIAILLLSPLNMLILDEPTNHLDIETREAIEETLSQYPGTILLVSHDRVFLHSLITHGLVLGE